MLWKLTRFELKKTLSGKFFWIVLCLLLIVTVLLNCGIGEYQEYLDLMKQMEQGIIAGGAPEHVNTFWEYQANNRRYTEMNREQYAAFAGMTIEDFEKFETAMREKYGENVLEVFMAMDSEAMKTLPGYFGDSMDDQTALFRYGMLQMVNQRIAEGMDSTLRAAQHFGGEAVQKRDIYGVRRNLNIMDLYSVPRDTFSFPYKGWNHFILDNPTMLMVVLMLLLICTGSVSTEKDGQTWLLLHTSKYGKGKTLAAKYFAGGICAVGVTAGFQLAALGGVWFRGGLMGLDQPVAAIEELQQIPYAITIGQYILIQLSCQVFAAVLFSSLLITVSALSKSSVIAYAAGTVFLGLFLLPVYFPPRTELLSGPLSLSAPLKYFDAYYTANLFGYPVLWVIVQAVVWCVLGVGCGILAHRVYHRKRSAV